MPLSLHAIQYHKVQIFHTKISQECVVRTTSGFTDIGMINSSLWQRLNSFKSSGPKIDKNINIFNRCLTFIPSGSSRLTPNYSIRQQIDPKLFQDKEKLPWYKDSLATLPPSQMYIICAHYLHIICTLSAHYLHIVHNDIYTYLRLGLL